MRSRPVILEIAFAVLAVVAVACGPQTAPLGGVPAPDVTAEPTSPTTTEAQRGGAIIVAISSDVDGLDPHRTVASPTFDVVKSIYDTLVDVDHTGTIVPGLATSWASSEDGLYWTFTLRDNVRFHNGRAMTSADVAFSFERVLSEESPRAKDFAAIDHLETPDEHTVVFILKEPLPAFVSNLALGWAAIVPSEHAGTLQEHPVGTGPFQFVEWVPDSHIELTRFDDYWMTGQPYLDQIEFRIIPDPAVQLTSLKAGEIDMAPVLPQNAAELKADSQIRVLSAPVNPVAAVTLLAINNTRKPFDDIRVRQALNYAIDKKALIEATQFGFATPIGSHMQPVSEYYVDLTDTYSYDPDKARQLLAAAGYPDGFETTITFANFDLHRRNAEVIASQLAQVGIEATLQSMELATWLDQVYQGRDYELNTLSHSGRLDPDPFLNRLTCDSEENYRNYCNPQFDELIQQGANTTDVAIRKEIYAKAQRLLAEDAASAWLYTPDVILGAQRSVHDYSFRPISGMDFREAWRSRP